MGVMYLEARGSALTPGHFLGHIKQEPPITLFDAAEKPSKTPQIARFSTRTAPCDVVRALPFGKMGKLGRFLAVIEKLVKRHFHGPRQLLQGFDCRNGMPVLDPRDIAAEEPGPLFDVALGKFLCFAQQTDAISNYHGGYCCME
jgi:hypothetical protein